VAGAQLGVEAALHDGKERGFGSGSGGEATAGPAGRALHRGFDFGARGAGGRQVVEAHHDVAADRFLDLDGVLGGEVEVGAVEVVAKAHPVLVDGAQLGEREDLEAAAVGEDRAAPAGHLVHAAEGAQAVDAGAHGEVVGIAEDDAGAHVFEFVGGEGLDGGRRADGHEDGGGDLAVRGLVAAGAGFGLGAAVLDVELQVHRPPSRRSSIASP
jgi:hypothetical protein